MFISRTEFDNDPSLTQKVRSWVASLNLAAKKSEAHHFKLTGPCELNVRNRTTGTFRGPQPSRPRAFMGGEEFQISSVSMEQDITRNGINIQLILTPVTMNLVVEIATMTLGLDRAIEVFDGLEAWVDVSVVETTAAQRQKIAEAAEVAHLPTVEETRASESWGAW